MPTGRTTGIAFLATRAKKRRISLKTASLERVPGNLVLFRNQISRRCQSHFVGEVFHGRNVSTRNGAGGFSGSGIPLRCWVDAGKPSIQSRRS